MSASNWNRRAVLAMMGASAAHATIPGAQALQVPWSSGTAPAKTKAPPNAADCHIHIYSSRYKIDPNATLRPGDAAVATISCCRNASAPRAM